MPGSQQTVGLRVSKGEMSDKTNVLLALSFNFMIDSRQIPGFHRVKIVGPGFYDLMAKFLNHHKKVQQNLI